MPRSGSRDRLTLRFVCAVSILASAVALIGLFGTVEGLASEATTRTPTAPAEPATTVFTKAVPESLDDLLAIEAHVTGLSERLIASTVAVRVGRAQGSGVIVSEDGYVLTAAHVSGRPGRSATVVLADGRQLKATTLGVDRDVDAGLMKITDEGEWPVAEMGNLDETPVGSWCVAVGHPGGLQEGRPPVVRLGRMILARQHVMQTDCTLVGGDSGGPLFDMQGKVVGIHSRIGAATVWNFHVPITAYTRSWDRLAASEAWGGKAEPSGPLLGVIGEDHPRGCRITSVSPETPAEEAGLMEGDVITKFNDRGINGFDNLFESIQKHKPGDEVSLQVLRDGETFELKAVLASRD